MGADLKRQKISNDAVTAVVRGVKKKKNGGFPARNFPNETGVLLLKAWKRFPIQLQCTIAVENTPCRVRCTWYSSKYYRTAAILCHYRGGEEKGQGEERSTRCA